jgi:hypothetical protein
MSELMTIVLTLLLVSLLILLGAFISVDPFGGEE